jgi:hypothetical protein
MYESVDLNHSSVLEITQTTPLSDQVALTIVNDFDVPICYVNFSLSTDTNWEPDRLGNMDVIQSGAERQWKIAPGTYDILLRDCENKILVKTIK